MGAARFAKALSAIVLFNSVLFLCVREDALGGEREDDAKKYTAQLRKGGKNPQTKIKALQELGALAQIKKSLIADAIPEVYKATEDKDPGIRAAAAECLGKADEPYDKAGPVLVKLLKEDKEESVKIGALRGLSAMGMSAKDALPTVRGIVKDNAGNKKSKLGLAAKDTVKAIGGGKK